MIATTFGVYLCISFLLTIPFVLRYVIVSYREKRMPNDRGMQLIRHFSSDPTAQNQGGINHMQKFLRNL